MRAVMEVVLSLLAVIGLLSLSWLLLGHLLSPVGSGEICTLVPGKGEGEDLEQTVRGLLWLRGGGLLTGDVVIVDCGLNPAGRTLAAAICLREPGVEVCPLSELSGRMREKTEDGKPLFTK